MNTNTFVKTSMNLPREELDRLKVMAAEENISMADMVRRALSTERFVRDTVKRGGKVLIEEKDKTLKHVIFR